MSHLNSFNKPKQLIEKKSQSSLSRLKLVYNKNTSNHRFYVNLQNHITNCDHNLRSLVVEVSVVITTDQFKQITCLLTQLVTCSRQIVGVLLNRTRSQESTFSRYESGTLSTVPIGPTRPSSPYCSTVTNFCPTIRYFSFQWTCQWTERGDRCRSVVCSPSVSIITSIPLILVHTRFSSPSFPRYILFLTMVVEVESPKYNFVRIFDRKKEVFTK